MTDWVVLDYWERMAKPANPKPSGETRIYDCGWYRFHAVPPPAGAVMAASTPASTPAVAHELHEVWVDVASSTDSLSYHEQGETFAEGRDIEEANPHDGWYRVGQKRREQRQCLPPVFSWILSHLF